jgi:ribosomal protein S18 acetylase RimI-like enzyme
MEIRIATTHDWMSVRNLFLTLLKNDPDAFADEYDIVSKLTDQIWSEKLSKDTKKTFIATEGGVAVGMGEVHFQEGEDGVVILGKLGVMPEYRGRGVAKELISNQEEWAKNFGSTKSRLYVMGDKPKTIEFYSKNGYEQVEFLKNDFKKSEGAYLDVVVMEKKLTR